MIDISQLEQEQQAKYPGLTVRQEGGAIVVHIPVNFHRRNGRQRILTQAGDDESSIPNPEPNSPLLLALAKAHRWQDQLESGEYAGLEDLAAANSVDRTYVGRILRLTSLAPDIIQALLAGNEPSGMSLSKLHKNLPLPWEEQRKRWPSEA